MVKYAQVPSYEDQAWDDGDSSDDEMERLIGGDNTSEHKDEAVRGWHNESVGRKTYKKYLNVKVLTSTVAVCVLVLFASRNSSKDKASTLKDKVSTSKDKVLTNFNPSKVTPVKINEGTKPKIYNGLEQTKYTPSDRQDYLKEMNSQRFPDTKPSGAKFDDYYDNDYFLSLNHISDMASEADKSAKRDYDFNFNDVSTGDLPSMNDYFADLDRSISHHKVAGDKTVSIPNEKANVIAILAERNSGLEWLYPKLVECFPNKDFTFGLTKRDGPWFQSQRLSVSVEPTLAIALFVNPYSWVDIMRMNPLHAPHHTHKDWFTFATLPWTMPRPNDDVMATVCQNNFLYNEILPCEITHFLHTDNPIYEMKCEQNKCKPFKNIVELRAAKIKNFLSVAKWDNVVQVLPVKYESFTEQFGFAKLVLQIEKYTGMKQVCPDTDVTAPVPPTKLTGKEKDEFRTWMNDNVDWSVEYSVGYEKDHLWGNVVKH